MTGFRVRLKFVAIRAAKCAAPNHNRSFIIRSLLTGVLYATALLMSAVGQTLTGEENYTMSALAMNIKPVK